MAEWKKVIVSGSSAELSNLFVTNAVTASYFKGDGSQLTGVAATSLDIDLFGSDLTGITVAGTDKLPLSDNGTEGRITVSQLSTPLAGTGLEANAGTIRIATGAAGTGLTGGGGSALAIDFTDAAFKSHVSGSFTAASASLAAAIAGLDSNYATDAELSAVSASLASDVATNAAAIASLDSTYATDTQLSNASASLAASITTNAGNISTNAGNISSNTSAISTLNGKTLFSGSAQVTLGGDLSGTAANATVAKVQGVALTSGEATQLANIDSVTISNAQWGYLGAANQGVATSDNVTFATVTSAGDVTVQGNLVVTGDTISANVTNLNVEDKFILLNSGSAAADAGFVVNGQGSAFGWDESASRFALDFAGATWNQTAITSDAFVAAVVTSDDANYRYNGNIRVQGGEIYMYVE